MRQKQETANHESDIRFDYSLLTAHCYRIIEGRRSNLPDEKDDIISSFDAVPAQREARGFTREQMVACEKCQRANPPTRMNCLYCGAALPANEATAALRRPVLRQLETWEQGFNVVLLPSAAESSVASGVAASVGAAFSEAASLLRLEPERVSEIASARKPLPLARVASREEASLVVERLRASGLQVETVADELLAVETQQPTRIRRLEFADDVLTGWSGAGDEAHVLAWTEIESLVSGRLFTKRIEMEERRTRLGMEKETVDAREMTDDAGVVEIFGRRGEVDWRIISDSFDYSCLGQRKSLLARENFVTLGEMLRARAASAAFDDDYTRLRHLLAAAWPLAEHTESRGLRRERPGKFNVEAATIVSNETQWTRYARLRNYYATKNR